MNESIRNVPYWQDGASAPPPPRVPEGPLPAAVDVLVVGAGYTGLAAARETAAAGLGTLVLDAGTIGAGCSGRNGGQVAYSIKPTLEELSARHGEARARAICREGLDAVDYLRRMASSGELDCDWRERGCYYGAHTARHFARMAHDAEHQPRGLEQRISVVTRAQQRTEIASDAYHGGCVYHEDASIDPMRLLLALLARAQAAGAAVRERCPALSIRSVRGGYEVMTGQGVVAARKVLLATNGYTGALSPWHRRRVIPIGSYQIATEALGADAVRALIPQGRNVVDSHRVVMYMRPSPDGQRIIFGGRAALAETDPVACVPRLRAMLLAIFPQLASCRVTHAWVGWVAYTFDVMPHLGRRENLFHCMGYCGQGVAHAPYFGRKIGQQMAELPEGRTTLDGLPFPSRPYYFGRPWFLAPSVWVYRTMDALGI